MTQGQFQIPQSSEVPMDSFTELETDTFFVNQEIIESERRYEEIKQLEQEIEALRANATEAHLPRLSRIHRARQAVTSFFVTNTVPRSLKDNLIEVESVIGGNILEKQQGIISQRFWFHDGDWFYEVHDAIGPMVARYRFEDDELIKIDGARNIPLVKTAEIDEAANIEHMVQLYHREITVQLYSRKDDYDLAA